MQTIIYIIAAIALAAVVNLFFAVKYIEHLDRKAQQQHEKNLG